MRMTMLAAMAAPLSLLLLAAPAAADAPDGQYTGHAASGGYSGGAPVTDNYSGGNGVGSATYTVPGASIDMQQGPIPFVEAKTNIADQKNAGALGTLYYWIQVSGTPDPLTDITLNAHIYGTISGNAGAPLSEPASWYSSSILVSFASYYDRRDISGYNSGYALTWDEFVSSVVHPGDLVQVTLEAKADALASGVGPGAYAYSRAYIDPYFYLNAGSPYSLSFSPGSGNVPVGFASIGVPEPASWAMMIGGFALAGAMLRRRRVGEPMLA